MNTRDIFESIGELPSPVPDDSLPNVCRYCLGAADGDFEQCADCWKLFRSESPCPVVLRGRVVPMSIVQNPSPWYDVLQKYKKAEFREHAPKLASFAWEWARRHSDDVRALLGGKAH